MPLKKPLFLLVVPNSIFITLKTFDMNYRVSVLVLFLGYVFLLSGCGKRDDTLVRVSTKLVSDYSNNTVRSGGYIIIHDHEKTEAASIVSRGVVWDETENPTVGRNMGITMDGAGDGDFNSLITGIKEDHEYFIRAYAIIKNDTLYGNQLTFKADAKEIGRIPTIYTKDISGVTNNTAISGGSLNIRFVEDADGYGLVWGSEEDPTVESHDGVFTVVEKTEDFTTIISGLLPNSSYYVRSFVKHDGEIYYGDEKTFTTYGDKIADIDGNIYYTISIGEQEWMAENLKATRYNDGEPIANITDESIWQHIDIGAYTFFDNNIDNKNNYGALYNYYAVKTNKLCPEGWAVPDIDQWNELVEHLGGAAIAGGKLKSTKVFPDDIAGWKEPNVGATNESRFSALPGGILFSSGMLGEGRNGYYWTSSERNRRKVWHAYLRHSSEEISFTPSDKVLGHSVRCIRNTDGQ